MAILYDRIYDLEVELVLSLSHFLAIDKTGNDSATKATLQALSTLIDATIRDAIINEAVAEARQYNVNNVADANYDILDDDGYNEINIDPALANRTAKFPDPTAVVNLDRKLKIKNGGDGSFQVLLAPFAAETFNVMSGNVEWTLASFALLQAGDWCEFICDGTNWKKCNEPYWHLIDDPTTGTKASDLTPTADSFAGGLEVTYSEAPIGSLAVRCVVRNTNAATPSNLFWRKSGDANISNTPNASGEFGNTICYHGLAGSTRDQVELWLSDDLKVQIAARYNSSDIYVYYPMAYLQ